jgi:hypothetical protein
MRPHFDTEDHCIAYYLNESRSHWKISKPGGLTLAGWRDFYRAARAQYPLRAFIQFDLPRCFNREVGYKISRFFGDLKWAFIHRFVKQHQYHVLRPSSLAPGYHDPDERILHACMDELKTYYEHGAPNVDWQSDKYHENVYNELTDIYNWWTKTYANRNDEPNVHVMKNYRQQEQDMLIRLMKIRTALWY